MSADDEQNRRIRDLEARVNVVENDMAAILAKLDVMTNILKGVMILAGAALGVDVIPMMGE